MGSGTTSISEGRGRRPGDGGIGRRIAPSKQPRKADFNGLVRDRGLSRVWALDEGRFGLKIWFRQRWCPFRVGPPWIVADRYEWRWRSAAVEPSSGQSFFLLLPRVDTTCLQAFLEAFGQQMAGERVGLVWDGSGAHRSAGLVWPADLVPLALPPYSPELNPVSGSSSTCGRNWPIESSLI